MRKLFLYSNNADNFDALLKPFIMADIETVKPLYAAGIDETAMLEISNETEVKVHGQKCFLFRREAQERYLLNIFNDGDEFEIDSCKLIESKGILL